MNTASTLRPGAGVYQLDHTARPADPLAAIDRLVWRVVGLCLAVAPPMLAFVPERPAPMMAPAAVATAAPAAVPAARLLPSDDRDELGQSLAR